VNALNRLGVSIDNDYASEIDKYARQITQNNYPNTIQLEDVTGHLLSCMHEPDSLAETDGMRANKEIRLFISSSKS
jgi:hypothetical protein